MKFNFRKITAIGASLLMAGMTAGMAAAANFPAPFVDNAVADVAVVYGTGTGVSELDMVQAGNIQTTLGEAMPATGGSTTISGESYALFTSASKIYMNDSMNVVRSTLTDTELPTVLMDGKFEGDVNADYTQVIKVGSNPLLEYGKHPTSDDEPTAAIKTSTSTSTPIYNLTVTFDQAVNFTSSDSIGEAINLFGREYTVGAGTTATKLYLYESSETIALSIGGSNPATQAVTVGEDSYTVELVGASDTAATVKVTDATGASQSKEVSEDASKRIQGIDVAVNYADESDATGQVNAEITVGANKILLQAGSKVKIGSDEDSVDGTLVGRTGDWTANTMFTFAIAADDTNSDAIVADGSLVDPVFGTVSLAFTELAGDSDRETITINPSTDKASIEFTTHAGATKDIYWYFNDSTTARLADADDSGNDVFNLIEMAQVNVTEYVMVGNENEGYLLELYEFDNDTDTTSDDIIFRDAMNPTDTYKVTAITTEGTGELIVGGKTYTVTYVDATAEGADYVRLNYPDSTTAATQAVIYPTIETSKGANLAFYEPITINLTNWDGNDLGSNATAGDLATLRFPDGDGYTDIDVEYTFGNDTASNWTIDSTSINSSNTGEDVNVTIGQLTYNIRNAGVNLTTVSLLDTASALITLPGAVLFEEKAQSSISGADEKYHAVIVKMEGAATSTAKIGVSDVETTWNSDGTTPDWDNLQSEADNDVYFDFDLWGTLVTVDKSDSDSYDAIISYPDEQLNAEISFAEADAVVTAGVNALGEVLIKDSEVDSMKTKNLIVVGGSCINSVAANLLGSACGPSFTEATGVGTGQFLIQSFGDAYTTGKIALLVAGYEVADTGNAATYLRTQDVDTMAGNKYIGTSSTEATLQVA